MKWYDKNPYGDSPSLYQEAKFEMHNFARQQFSSNFARRGWTSWGFGLTAKERFQNYWKGPIKENSFQHIKNLEFMVSKDPTNTNYINTLEKAKAAKGKMSMAGKAMSKGSLALHYGVPLAGAALPMFTTPGSIKEKVRATAGGAVGFAGWAAGAKLGGAIGAAAGGGILSPITGGIGILVGGLIGATAVDEGFQAITRIPDQMVQRERNKRQLNWINDNSAFQTRNAATMRQQSLAAMNRGMMNSRSVLGREAMFLHR